MQLSRSQIGALLALSLAACQGTSGRTATKVFYLNHSRAERVLAAIRNEGTFGARVTADAARNAIVAEGPIASLVQLRSLITRLDTPQ